MNDLVERLGALKIIPVVTLDSADRAPEIADALVAGGLPCAKITFRTAAALPGSAGTVPSRVGPPEAPLNWSGGLGAWGFRNLSVEGTGALLAPSS